MGSELPLALIFFPQIQAHVFFTPRVFLGLIRLIDSVHDCSFIRLGYLRRLTYHLAESGYFKPWLKPSTLFFILIALQFKF
jgi:hypothetical protein